MFVMWPPRSHQVQYKVFIFVSTLYAILPPPPFPSCLKTHP